MELFRRYVAGTAVSGTKAARWRLVSDRQFEHRHLDLAVVERTLDVGVAFDLTELDADALAARARFDVLDRRLVTRLEFSLHDHSGRFLVVDRAQERERIVDVVDRIDPELEGVEVLALDDVGEPRTPLVGFRLLDDFVVGSVEPERFDLDIGEHVVDAVGFVVVGKRTSVVGVGAARRGNGDGGRTDLNSTTARQGDHVRESVDGR